MKGVIRLFFFLAFILMLLSSCLDDDTNNAIVNDYAAGLVYNASPDSDNLFFYADNNRVNNQPLSFNDGQGYFSFFTGNRNIGILNQAGEELVNQDLLMRSGQYYSIFAVDSLSKISVLALEDNLDYPANGTFWLRFVHLSPDAPEVNFLVGEETLSGFQFKDFSEFQPFEAGTYDLTITDAEGNSILSHEGVNLQNGYIYTYFASGFAGSESGETNALSLNRIVNFRRE